MTRVMHVITRMIIGGAPESTLSSVVGLSALTGYEVSLVTGPETGSEGNLLEGLKDRVHVIVVPELVRAISPRSDGKALAKLYRTFRELRPDIVHTHVTKAGVLGRVAAGAARVPVVVHTLHGLVFDEYQSRLVRTLYRGVKRSLVPLTDHYTSVCDDVRERAIRAGIGAPENHTTIRSGFDTDDFVANIMDRREARARLQLPGDRLVVGVVARLFPLKGHDEILWMVRHVVRRHPDILLVLVGDGPLRETLQERCAEWGLTEHVRFLGLVHPSCMPVIFSALDVLAHASLREGLARVLPQAVLAGVPVVCYRIGGAAEVIRDGANGFVIDPGDLHAFANRLDALLADDQMRVGLGGSGREAVRAEYSTAAMISALDNLYQRLLPPSRS